MILYLILFYAGISTFEASKRDMEVIINKVLIINVSCTNEIAVEYFLRKSGLGELLFCQGLSCF